MSGHAYSGEDLNKIRHAYVFHDGEFKKLRKAWYFKNGEFHQVWSGASEVSYYDGDTFLGMREVDEGESVLHPDIDTSKEGYTLVAWKSSVYGDPLDELLATGEPMTVYAIYVPNTITVARGTVTLDRYTLSLQNSEYVTGVLGNHDARASYYVGPAWISSGFNVEIKMGFYQNGTLNFTLINEAPFDVSASYMGSPTSLGAHSVSISASGNYYGSSRGYVDWHTSGGTTGGITSLVLTNPKAWV